MLRSKEGRLAWAVKLGYEDGGSDTVEMEVSVKKIIAVNKDGKVDEAC